MVTLLNCLGNNDKKMQSMSVQTGGNNFMSISLSGLDTEYSLYNKSMSHNYNILTF